MFGLASFVHQMENQVISDLPTDSFLWSDSWCAEISMCVVCDDDDPGVCLETSSCLSLHSCLQQGAGHQLYLWRVAAVDVRQGVGSQVGHQQFRAPVQQVEHVLC